MLAAKTYTNPIFDEDFPDPAVIQAPDGYYYAYATQTLRDGRWINIQVARSSDLVDWEYLGDAMPEKPVWAPRLRTSGPLTSLRWRDVTSCIIRRRPMPATTGAGPLPCGRHVATRLPAPSWIWACRCSSAWALNISIRWPLTTRSPAKTALLGLGLSADQGPGAGGGPHFVRARAAAHRPGLAKSRQGGVPKAGRGRLGHPSRRILLSVLFGRQLLRTRCRLWSDGRAIPQRRRARSRRWSRPRASRIASCCSRANAGLRPGHNSIVTDKAGDDWIVYHAIDVNRTPPAPTGRDQ